MFVPLSVSSKPRNVNKEDITYPIDLIPLKVADPAYAHLKVGNAIVRTDTHELVGVVSQKVKIIPHIIIADTFEDTIKRAGADLLLCDIKKGGAHGTRIDIDFLLPDYKFDIDGDTWTPCFQLTSTYELGVFYGVRTGFYREDNMSLVLFRKLLTLSKTPRTSWWLLDSKEVISLKQWIDDFSDARKIFYQLLRESVDTIDVKKLIHTVIRNKDKHLMRFYERGILKKYVENYGRTYYAVFNALIEYATHGVYDEPVSRKRAYDRSEEMQRDIGYIFFEGGLKTYLK